VGQVNNTVVLILSIMMFYILYASVHPLVVMFCSEHSYFTITIFVLVYAANVLALLLNKIRSDQMRYIERTHQNTSLFKSFILVYTLSDSVQYSSVQLIYVLLVVPQSPLQPR